MSLFFRPFEGHLLVGWTIFLRTRCSTGPSGARLQRADFPFDYRMQKIWSSNIVTLRVPSVYQDPDLMTAGVRQ